MLAYIDHATIAVADAAGAADRLRDTLSLIVSKPRVDEESGMTNAIVPLTRGYLELVSPAPLSAGAPKIVRRLHAFLDSHEGLFSYALNSRDVAGDVAMLRERGSTLGEPERQDVGDGVWWSAFPADEDLEPYLIQHDDDAAVSMSMTGGRQPLGIRSVEEVTLVVPDPSAVAVSYERDLGMTVTRTPGRQLQLSAGTSRVMLVASAGAPLGTPIGLFSVSLGTTDIKGAQATLRQRGIEFSEALFSWGIAVQIDPALTCGAKVNLVQL
jgi:hypothetical protein